MITQGSKGSSKSTLGALGVRAVGGGLLGALAAQENQERLARKAGVRYWWNSCAGALAYKVYNDYQAKQGTPDSSPQATFVKRGYLS
ncbi:tellurite resistance TerB family protein [Vibrio chagasii]|nr:tellurite resistance TerB family protein [Vibrio chagasii]